MRIKILFGTQSGTAEMVADELLSDLEDKGFEASTQSLAKASSSVFEEDAFFLIVTASYGEGDLPEKVRPFLAKLEAEKPNLSNVRYAMFGLGDKRGHPHTYCFGANKLDAALAGLGAHAATELECHDLGDKKYPDDHAVEWAQGVLEPLNS